LEILNGVELIKNELNKYIDKENQNFFARFFKTGSGEYAEGVQLIGIAIPNQRKVACKFYNNIKLYEVEMLLREPIHEYRSTALFVLCLKFEKAEDEWERTSVVTLYLQNISFVNNWDLVDASAYKILGAYLMEKNKDILYEFAYSNELWKQRIAIIATFHFIRNKQFDDTLKIAEILLHHKHDLIHKAVGWMLREIGNRNAHIEIVFLKQHYKQMPRTMLRYAIEKFDEELRQSFLKGTA
jgi:3-methyladenine DNA glycosylase AlkD